MAFLDNLKKVGEAGLDKAKEVGEIGKLKVKKAGIETDVKNTYVEIAKALIEKNPEFFAENFGELKEKLEGFIAQIADLDAQLATFKDKEE